MLRGVFRVRRITVAKWLLSAYALVAAFYVAMGLLEGGRLGTYAATRGALALLSAGGGAYGLWKETTWGSRCAGTALCVLALPALMLGEEVFDVIGDDLLAGLGFALAFLVIPAAHIALGVSVYRARRAVA